MSEDGTLALIVLALDPKIVGGKGLNTTVDEIRKTMKDDLGDTGLTVQLSGVPIMQLEIRNAVERDRLLYNTIGFAAGCLIAIAFFRRVSFMIVAAAPPLIAILLSLGALGWLNFSLNMFLNVMTPLIMVISFSDSMQLTFAARDRLIAGEEKYQAFRNAVLVVGPACVLTHGTAGISFIALQFSSSDLIRTFGEAGLLATVIALAGRAVARAAARRAAGAQGSGLCRQDQRRGYRRRRVAPLLQLDGDAHGQPSRALQPAGPCWWSAALASSTPTSSRATAWPTRCRTSGRRSRRAAGSTPSSPAPIRSTC